MTEMLRYNNGKTPLSLIPASFTKTIVDHYVAQKLPIATRLMWQVGQVLDFGAKKYNVHNWRKGGSWTNCLNSALRHLVKMVNGATVDDESGLLESGHLGCNLAFLLEFQLRGLGEDDRFHLSAGDRALNSFNFPLRHPLYEVWNYLLAWQEGGDEDRLRDAIIALADYVENDPLPPPPSVKSPVPANDGDDVDPSWGTTQLSSRAPQTVLLLPVPRNDSMTTRIIVGLRLLTPTAKAPVYSSAEAAGADLHADLTVEGNTVVIPAGGRKLVQTGVSIELPGGFEAQVRPRSGLALKRGITVLNSPGTIDSDYRGGIGVVLLNTSDEDFTINHGDRIAQLVIAPVVRTEFTCTGGITRHTERGERGYGSTGL